MNMAIQKSPLWSQDQAAQYISTTKKYLAKMRYEGRGPVFVQLGHKIFYLQSDLDNYILERRTATSSQQA